MTTTERDLVEEVEELLAKVPNHAPDPVRGSEWLDAWLLQRRYVQEGRKVLLAPCIEFL